MSAHGLYCLMVENQVMTEARQHQLSQFFYGWDHGNLVKGCVQGKWRIANRYAGGTYMATLGGPKGPPRPPLRCVIDRETLGLKVR